MTLDDKLTQIKKELRIHKKNSVIFARMVSETNFKNYKPEEITDRIKAIYKEIFGKVPKF